MKIVQKLTTRTSGGILSKAWAKDGETYYLLKGNSHRHYEPYSEVLASRMAEFLEIPTVVYELDEAGKYPEIKTFDDMQHVSSCQHYGYPTEKLYELLDSTINAKWVYSVNTQMYLRKLEELGMNMRDFVQLLVFDAFIGNQDRHVNNFEVYIKDDKLTLAPGLDYGGSLLALVTDIKLKRSNGVGPDKSKPFSETHAQQLRTIDRLVGIPRDLFDKQKVREITFFASEQRDVLRCLDEKRRNIIIHYIQQRAQEYLLPYSK